jgi:hypothetical protein
MENRPLSFSQPAKPHGTRFYALDGTTRAQNAIFTAKACKLLYLRLLCAPTTLFLELGHGPVRAPGRAYLSFPQPGGMLPAKKAMDQCAQ